MLNVVGRFMISTQENLRVVYPEAFVPSPLIFIRTTIRKIKVYIGLIEVNFLFVLICCFTERLAALRRLITWPTAFVYD